MYNVSFAYFLVLHTKLGCVQTAPCKFENTAVFTRLGLPSTLRRWTENGAFRKRLLESVDKFKNAG